MAPFADTDKLFAASQYSGYRFLVVRTAGDSCTGRIVELLTKQPAAPEKAADLALAGAKPFLTGSTPGPVANFTGALLVYSPAYTYEAGLAYAAGALQPLRMSVYTALPGLPPPDTCYDYYLVGYDNTGAQVVHDYLFSSCSGGIPSLGTSWGGGGGTPTTGGGGTGINNYTPFVVAPGNPVTNLQNFLKCFDTSKGATMTVYVRQPVPGTADTYKIAPNGKPDVGHTFLSITQNGITRVLGFYPTSSVAILFDSPGVMGDNSQTPYTTSITIPLSVSGLSNVLGYIYLNSGVTYSLNNFNCTNFAIGAAAAGGLVLPSTPGQWGGGLVGGGLNPGNLGQDISTMPLPPGAQRSTAGTSPSNNGGC